MRAKKLTAELHQSKRQKWGGKGWGTGMAAKRDSKTPARTRYTYTLMAILSTQPHIHHTLTATLKNCLSSEYFIDPLFSYQRITQ
jgi:hypothetical protein